MVPNESVRYDVATVVRCVAELAADGGLGDYADDASTALVDALAHLGGFEVMSTRGRWIAAYTDGALNGLCAVGDDPLAATLALAGESTTLPPELVEPARAVAARLLLAGRVTIHGARK